MNQCLYCNKITSNLKFCNRSCSVSYNNRLRKPRTLESKAKTSSALKKHFIQNPLTEEAKLMRSISMRKRHGISDAAFTKIFFKKCTCCKRPFVSPHKNKSCCSPECARINQTYRKIIHLYEHDGKVIKLESSWEVMIAEWLDSHGIIWTRPKHIPWEDSTGKSRKYFPDFYLPESKIYLDPKNEYQISISKEKLEKIQVKIRLIYGNVEYIKQTLQGILESNQAT